jgi:Spy/CpxP family protein refolding chaperone
MKRQIARLMAVGSVAAGMIFAQAQTAPATPQGQQNQAQSKAQSNQNNRAKRSAEGFRSNRAAEHQRMMTALNLTPDQKEKAKAIFDRAHENSQPVRRELRQNREAMAAAVKSDDKAQIEKLSAERGRLTAKLSANRGEAMAKFYQVLTPSQRAKAEQMRASRTRQFRNEHRGMRTTG